MTYRFVQRNTVANRDFFTFSGPTPFSATGSVVGTGLTTSLLTTAVGFGIPKACACGCGGRGVGTVVGNGRCRLLPSSELLPLAACYDTGDLLDLLIFLF
jgi:hypothetical protein